jgi:RNA polymerase sigma factor (sigma-70 family)
MKNGIERLRALVDDGGPTDAELLERYVVSREPAAVEALIRRHGGMVWGVCCRLLHNFHDAEDAFQATFLVLLRRAGCVAPRELVANWLYGVACQTALKARASAAKRRTREKQVLEMPQPEAAEQKTWSDLQPLLDKELSRLPQRQRAVILLCDLEGKTRKQAARQLGVPEGSVAGWLARGRTTLAKRLSRRGLMLSGGALATLMSQSATAGVPATVLAATVKVAGLAATEPAVATGLVSASVAALADGVVKTMLLRKLKTFATVLLAAAVLIAGKPVYNTLAEPTPSAEPNNEARPPEKTPAQYETEPALAGRWLMTLPAGFRYVVTVRRLGEQRFALEQAVRFSGHYELRGRRLVLVGPVRDGDPPFEWELASPHEMSLVAQPPTSRTGSDYLGAALRKLPEPGATGPGGEWGAATAGVRALVETANEELRFPAGTPIEIVCRAKNFGKDTVVYHESDPPFQLHVTGPDRKPVPHTPRGARMFQTRPPGANAQPPGANAPGSPPLAKLPPRAEITAPYRLDELFEMTRVGGYRVSFTYELYAEGKNEPLTVTSNVLMIGVSPTAVSQTSARNGGGQKVAADRPPRPGITPATPPERAGPPEPVRDTTAAAAPLTPQEQEAADALKRIKAQYRLRKEPAYRAPVQYCLLLLGGQEPVRMWLASDGVTMYVDRNGNGDLTDPGEAVPFKAEGFAAFFANPLPGRSGVEHTHLHIAVRQRDWQNNKGGYWAVRADVEGRCPMYAFAHKFAKKFEDAPVIHLGGPLRMGLYELQGGSLKPGREADLAAYVVCQYPGVEKAFVDVDQPRCPKDIHPVAEILLPAKTPGAEPIKLRVPLTQRC